MKLAIMQPYFFPYIGYFQLMQAVDRFVVYDDVNYRKGGWINRNRILINGAPSYITVPLQQASPNKKICDISLSPSLAWREKMIRTIENVYRRAPFYAEAFPVIESAILYQESCLSEYLVYCLKSIANYLDISTEIVGTSRVYQNADLHGESRVIDICARESATTYINPQGGQELYATRTFRESGLNLKFLCMRPLPYRQRAEGFVPYLSILDAVMELGSEGLRDHLGSYDLVSA